MHKIITFIVLILLGVFSAVWQQVQIVKTGKFLGQEEQRVEGFKLRNRMLEIKIANLTSLERIESISKAELGLSRAKEYRVVYLKPQRDTRVAVLPDNKPVNKNMFAKIFRKMETVAEAREV